MAVIIEDSRNQPGKHNGTAAYIEAQGHKVVRSKMYVGDYQLADSGKIAVDTKQNVLELIMDIHQEHRRFRDECIRAKEAGIQLYILVEEYPPGGKLVNWRSPVYKSSCGSHRRGDPISRADPVVLRRALVTMTERYGVQFRFCHKRDSGRTILELLGVSGDADQR